MLPADPLEVIKFLCKDVWQELFGKPIDKLQTNHRGVFVLKDNDFKWLARHSGSEPQFQKAASHHLNFPCGLIRGALENLGISSLVSADFSPEEAGRSDKRPTAFHVRIR